jgi:superfamily II DNA/RNA helicase
LVVFRQLLFDLQQSMCRSVATKFSIRQCKASSLITNFFSQYKFIPAKQKDLYLVHILSESASKGSVIVFTDTVRTTSRVALLLRALGFPAVPLHGQMTQPKRLGALNKFKSGDRRILIATDVASRYIIIRLVLSFHLFGSKKGVILPTTYNVFSYSHRRNLDSTDCICIVALIYRQLIL